MGYSWRGSRLTKNRTLLEKMHYLAQSGYLPLVRLEYDRAKAELNSLKAELSITVQIYQQFVDSNVALKKRENELRQTIDELEAKKAELQKPKFKLNEPLLEFHDNNGNKDVSLEVQQEDIISINDISILQPNISINYHQNESETLPSSSQAKQSSRTLIFDTKDLFLAWRK